MSVACSILADEGRAGRLLHGLAWFAPGLGLSGSIVCLASGGPTWLLSTDWGAAFSQGTARIGVIAGLATMAILFLMKSWRALQTRNARHLLNLTAAGSIGLDGHSFRLHCLSRLPGLIVLVLAPISRNDPKLTSSIREERRARVVLLARDAQSEEAWRRLNVWLLWVERGGGAAPA